MAILIKPSEGCAHVDDTDDMFSTREIIKLRRRIKKAEKAAWKRELKKEAL